MLTKDEAIQAILLLATKHQILTLVIHDINPHLKIDCFNPHADEVDLTGRVIGESVWEGSDVIQRRVLHLEIHLNDDYTGSLPPPSGNMLN